MDGFVEQCIEMCKSDKKAIIKQMLHKKFKQTRDNVEDSVEIRTIPTDPYELIKMDPTSEEFVEYTYSAYSLENHMKRDDILKLILTSRLEKLLDGSKQQEDTVEPVNEEPVNAEPVNVEPIREETRQKRQRFSSIHPPRMSTRTQNVITLPNKLESFRVVGKSEPILHIEDVMKSYFIDYEQKLPCIYKNKDRSFVLYVPQRYSNKWQADGDYCKFKWSTPEQDTNRQIFSDVISMHRDVHVIRQRGCELMYMGKCRKVEDAISTGSCTMFVS